MELLGREGGTSVVDTVALGDNDALVGIGSLALREMAGRVTINHMKFMGEILLVLALAIAVAGIVLL